MTKKKAKSKKVTTPEQKKITLTIRAHKPDEIKALNELLLITKEKTYAGALMKAAATLPKTEHRSRLLEIANLKLTEQIQQLQSIFDKWLSSRNEMENIAKNITKQVHRPYPLKEE